MVFVGYHASQEQIAPSRLLEDVVDAETAGFDGAFTADHLAPWTAEQGQSGNTPVWLGAALARTTFSIGAVATPGQRVHPVVAAQEFATLAEMFPGRFFAALGSGELLNEHVTGDPWPTKPEREERLIESVDVIRRLLAGDEVTHRGRVTAHRARLWTRPAASPALWATATTPRTAAWAAGWADGLLTVAADPDAARTVIEAYRDAGGAGETGVQVHVAVGSDPDALRALVRDQWSHAVVTPPERWDVALPEEFAARGAAASDDELLADVVTARDAAELADRLAAIVAAGADRLYVHEISQDQTPFLREVAPAVLRALRAEGGRS